MSKFDYISSPEFRASLESDDLEMRTCAAAGAWKSAQVLAGSIVESLLVDYLTSTPKPERTQKDPLKLDLAEAISICRSEKALSDRSADLCSVVRSYRNLIHPGRMVRLNEPAPDRTTCDIAMALIDLIVGEIATTRRAAVGLTAEQIISKVLRDPGCVPILKHMLLEVSEAQKTRLLLTIFPDAFFKNDADDDPFKPSSDHISAAYRAVLESVDEPIRERVARRFVSELKEADGYRVQQYRDAFFRASDLEYLNDGDQALVKEHLLGSVTGIHSSSSLLLLVGIGEFLVPSDGMKWADPYIKTIVHKPSIRDGNASRARQAFMATTLTTDPEFDARLIRRLNDWYIHFEKLENADSAEIVRVLKEEVEALSPP